ncbi:MAG: zinc ribbon domain-containing protein [Clostridia bacterium]|nr:zinc ribbon domain-containing protein [Clostridia bacterium]
MALIKCPDCGKDVSNQAKACPFCGCPIGSGAAGVLRVELRTFLKLIGNVGMTVSFEGQTARLNRGYYKDFVVPADGKKHTAKLSCEKYGSIFGSAEFTVTLNSGESKHVIITYNDGNFINKWEYREQMFITR